MGSSMKTTGVARGMSRSCIALLLFTCSLATQNLGAETGGATFGILFWFMAPGRMVPAGGAFTTFL